jgi:molecular chaperone GrpE (heat shock protein)
MTRLKGRGTGQMSDRASAEEYTDPADVEIGVREDPMDLVLEQLKSLREAFDAKIRYDETRERLVESMSDELTAYRKDLYQKLLRPVLLDLIGMYDDLTQMLEPAACQPETAEQLGFLRDGIEQILARNGAERFVIDGETIDRARQKVVRVTETPKPDLDRQVERRLRAGFSWNGKVLRPEWVSAYRYVGDSTEGPALPTAEATNDLPGETADPTQLAQHAEEGASS